VSIVPGLKAGVLLAEALRRTAQVFRVAGIEEPEVDARVLIGHALNLDRAKLVAQGQRELEAREVKAIAGLAARRLKREPVARILGEKEFWSLPLTVTPVVLVPRPETETVVELALDALAHHDRRRMENLRLLDIGTGSGALLLALLSELPHAIGTGTDISADALVTARANAARNGLADRCQFVACDIAAGVIGSYDLIVSNPPYIRGSDINALAPEVRDYDPRIALDGGGDGFDAYRAIGGEARRLLAPNGRLVVELGAGQEFFVHSLFTKAGLAVDGVRADLAGMPRALLATAP
jgi:release factor glutamine methyltransferase